MIDEATLEQLISDMELGWSDPVKMRYGRLKEILDTLTAALLVVKAARRVLDLHLKNEKVADLRQALKPFERSDVSETNSSPGGKEA